MPKGDFTPTRVTYSRMQVHKEESSTSLNQSVVKVQFEPAINGCVSLSLSVTL